MSVSAQLILEIGRSLAWRERAPARAGGQVEAPELVIEPGTPSRADDTPTRGLTARRR